MAKRKTISEREEEIEYIISCHKKQIVQLKESLPRHEKEGRKIVCEWIKSQIEKHEKGIENGSW